MHSLTMPIALAELIETADAALYVVDHFHNVNIDPLIK